MCIGVMCIGLRKQNYAGETELQVRSTGRLSVSVQQTSIDNDLLKVII